MPGDVYTLVAPTGRIVLSFATLPKLDPTENHKKSFPTSWDENP